MKSIAIQWLSLFCIILAGIIEYVRSGGVRPDTHFPNLVDGCGNCYLPRRFRTVHKECVVIPKISCERRTIPLRTDSMIPANTYWTQLFRCKILVSELWWYGFDLFWCFLGFEFKMHITITLTSTVDCQALSQTRWRGWIGWRGDCELNHKHSFLLNYIN